jgi:rare lipoprotein A
MTTTTQQRMATLVGSVALALAALAPAAAQAETGKISYYGAKFAGRPTASGERFDPNAMTMAHKTLPFGSKVKVTNLSNQRSVILRVNDRGPHVAGRVADVSHAAARKLAMTQRGVVKGKLTVVARG